MNLIPRRAAPALAAVAIVAGLAGCHKSDADSAAAPAASGPVAPVPAPAGKQWSDVLAVTADHGMRMGNPDAPIKLVEYGSLSCPHCAHLANEAMPKLVGHYVNSGEVSYEYRSFAIHGIDIPLTVLVRCAEPTAFFALVEQLYSGQDALLQKAMANQKAAEDAGKLPPGQRVLATAEAYGLIDWFSARGLPTDKARVCLSNTANAQEVASEAETIGNNGIDSTPTLVINGAKSPALDWPGLETALKGAGAS